MNDANAEKPKSDKPCRDARAHEFFLEIIDLPEARQVAKMDEFCGDDTALREAVESLLAADRDADGFLESPIAVDGAQSKVGSASLATPSSAEDEDPLVGMTVDDFVIETRIGTGGMGVVYAARQKQPDRKVAIKVVRDSLVSAKTAQRLVFESEILSRLQHPHVAQIYTAGTIAGSLGQSPYFAMEYVQGAESITSFCEARGLGMTERLTLFLAACSAVQHGHERGVIHRDLKPSNVLVDETGKLKVIDFGIARVVADDVKAETLLTQPGLIMGSLPYMAPEQCTGGAHLADARSDVYALGAILYELLCEEPVFDVSTKSLEESLRAIREAIPLEPHRHQPGIDRDLESIVLWTLAKEPKRRYDSVAQLIADVRRFQHHEPVLAARPSWGRHAWLLCRRNPMAASLTMLLALTLVAATIVSASLFVRANLAREALRVERDDAEAARIQAEAIMQFTQDMLASIDPENARGEQVSMFDFLSEAALTVEQELHDQPLVKAAIHLTIGRTYLSLGRIPEAEQHLVRALDLRGQSLKADHPDIVDSLAALAELRMAESRLEEAVALYQRILSIQAEQFGQQSEPVADSLGNLGAALRMLGRYQEAEDALRESLAMYTHLEVDHARTANSLNNLGSLLIDRADYAGAERALREALALRREHIGNDHPDTATTLNNLAVAIDDLGKLDEARRLYEESLAVRRRAYGKQHPKVALAMNALGLFLVKHGQYVEAEPYLREALTMRRALLQADHPGVAVSLNNLALLLSKLGRFEDALGLYRESLEMRRRIYGSGHFRVATALRNLAGVSRKMGDLAEAEDYAREALRLVRSLFDADHPRVMDFTNALAVTLKARGLLDEAAPLYREVLEHRRKRFGENHVRVALCEVNLALLLFAQRDFDEAEPLARQAVKTMRHVHGDDNVNVAWALHALGSILMMREDYENAEEALSEALVIQQRMLPSDHPDTARTLDTLGRLSLRHGDPAKAEARIRESLVMLRRLLPANPLRTGNASLLVADGESILGACLSRQGQYEEAENLLVGSYQLIAAARGESDATSVDARVRIAELYASWGKPQDRLYTWKKRREGSKAGEDERGVHAP